MCTNTRGVRDQGLGTRDRRRDSSDVCVSVPTLFPSLYPLSPAGAARRGVLLLVVLSLLVLFVMIALTYVLVATRHLQANKSLARKDITGEPPRKLLDGAMMQVAVGAPGSGTTASPIHSVIGPWSLLEHMYGTNTVSGTAANAKLYANNEIL